MGAASRSVETIRKKRGVSTGPNAIVLHTFHWRCRLLEAISSSRCVQAGLRGSVS
jgi:hypothetical protein